MQNTKGYERKERRVRRLIGQRGADCAMDAADNFSKIYFETALEITKEHYKRIGKKFHQGEYAVKVFGYEKAFYGVRSGEMRLTLSHAYRMAELADWKFSRLIDLVRIKIEESADLEKINGQ